MSERSEEPQVTVELAGRTAEERMSLGQLLSWLEFARIMETEVTDPESAERYRGHIVDAEAVLARWEEGLLEEPDEFTEGMTLLMARRAVEQGNMEVFLYTAGSSSLNVLAPMARYALGFNRPWDRLVALAEVVLAGEARASGLEAAERRRAEWRGEVLHGLKERIAEVMPRIPQDRAHP